jgi:hypothetical protein
MTTHEKDTLKRAAAKLDRGSISSILRAAGLMFADIILATGDLPVVMGAQAFEQSIHDSLHDGAQSAFEGIAKGLRKANEYELGRIVQRVGETQAQK